MKQTVPAYDDRLPLYQRLRDDMLARIAGGEWQTGLAIPTEIELTKLYGVAIGTVRKAVETLVADGMLERNQGRGTFIRRPSFDASLFRFFRHQVKEGQPVAPQSRILERTLTAPPAAVADALGLGKKAHTIRLDRLRLVDGKPVLLEEIWLPQAQFSALAKIDITDFPDLLYPFYEERCGKVIASAQETLTVACASDSEAGLLEIQAGQPVVIIERLAFGYDRQPLEWRRSRGPADGFRYQVEIR
ncbi:GntR family transcriptional regulator [Janthinobacterium agaricidamnosum]|uniref:Bacterial regulatory s, gntR family protein n=1 Tax=Janthinobacterium agaricidamnosum NBRC 102515 = DSM 9628 TaxID=1349767 RepID=W0VB16_9BURK|nr:GntR family transcriptional regulator [Janthinobacterium agaricidamnosum]CDG84447.1 bacterial regulatory s, gntR family protein [Janthinobacterium agaricidamnosum NBRC 102515 = DSM 9628]